jgi:hypothetical protein
MRLLFIRIGRQSPFVRPFRLSKTEAGPRILRIGAVVSPM